MTLDIQTSTIEPRRQTFANIARRQGADKPASRYDEAVLDVQATANFHYRPTWAPEYELFDPKRTAIQMADWYALRDPRQFYYGTWNISRAGMLQATERNFAFVEERDMLSALDDGWKAVVLDSLLPLRHYEWGANMNNWLVCDYGYGTAITSAAAFNAADRLGMAQLLTRIGLALDDQTGKSLDPAKEAWMKAPHLQGLRHAMEDLFVVEDWFETFVGQNLAMDGIVFPLVYGDIERVGMKRGGTALSMLTEFMADWSKDSTRWVDAVVKTAAAESEANAGKLSAWFSAWRDRAVAAAGPFATHVLGADEGAEAVKRIAGELDARAAKLGLGV